MLQETKLKLGVVCFRKYCKRWEGIFREVIGQSGGLGVMWDSNMFKVELVESEHK